MSVTVLLVLAALSAPLSEQEVEGALASLNLYVEGISHCDACLRRSDMRLVNKFDQRIREVRARAVAEFPHINLDTGKGETDYVCTRRSDEGIAFLAPPFETSLTALYTRSKSFCHLVRRTSASPVLADV